MSGREAAGLAAVPALLIAGLQPTSLKHEVESKSEEKRERERKKSGLKHIPTYDDMVNVSACCIALRITLLLYEK